MLPVVIAGAGPTGLMCAIALARQGVRVVVCEAEPSLTHDLRAGTFHPPTQEMMAPYGITERMHEHGLQVRRWQIRSRRGGMVAEFDLGVLAGDTPYPYRLHLEQHRLTPIQLDALRRTIDSVDAEVVVSATPCDLGALIEIGKPVVRVRYEFAELDVPGLGERVLAFVDQRQGRSAPG